MLDVDEKAYHSTKTANHKTYTARVRELDKNEKAVSKREAVASKLMEDSQLLKAEYQDKRKELDEVVSKLS